MEEMEIMVCISSCICEKVHRVPSGAEQISGKIKRTIVLGQAW